VYLHKINNYLPNLLFLQFTQRENINYGIYCCDWTSMDLRYRKLMLLTMRINKAIQILIRATPTKIVNLQLFVSVTHT